MDFDNIECVSSSDGLDEDEIRHHNLQHLHQFASSKPHNVNNNNHNGNTIVVGGPTAIAPATSVHELLECPVCTNSMYPPIHQVCFSMCLICYENVNFAVCVHLVLLACFLAFLMFLLFFIGVLWILVDLHN